jgi:3D (Asp-Asp-Asp) domain-containing protein
VFEQGVPLTFESLDPTVGEALRREGLLIFSGDEVRPGLETPLTAGTRVFIERGVPLTLEADGRHLSARVVGDSVADALARQGIALRGKDYTLPGLDTPLTAEMSIRVVRVSELWEIEESPIDFETRWVPDPELELDQWQVRQAGAQGLRRRLERVVYEDGEEVRRIAEQEWVAQEPTPKVLAYGTRIAVRELSTAQGTLRYWRHLRMLATSYTAATSGKSRNHPAYGITRTGIRATLGVVAVDPRVVRLGTQLYVPGYGTALAADTGGAIKGRRIDLAYDEDNLVLWRRWVDIYLLEPVPSPEQIPWVIPAWPAER